MTKNNSIDNMADNILKQKSEYIHFILPMTKQDSIENIGDNII